MLFRVYGGLKVVEGLGYTVPGLQGLRFRPFTLRPEVLMVGLGFRV